MKLMRSKDNIILKNKIINLFSKKIKLKAKSLIVQFPIIGLLKTMKKFIKVIKHWKHNLNQVMES